MTATPDPAAHGAPGTRPRLRTRLRAWCRREWPGLVGVAVLVVLAIWLRGDSLLSGVVINPDEAELLAEGKRAALSWIPYATSTDSTHLYPWPLALALLGRAGLSLGLPLAHLLSALAYVFVLATCWWCLHRRIGVLLAALAVGGPALALLGARDSTDFLSMTSELLPIALMAIALLLVFAVRGGLTRWRFAIACMALGVAPIAKPQSLLLTLAIWAVVVGLWVQQRPAEAKRARRWIEGGAWGVVPGAVLLIAMAAGGTLDRFLSEPVSFQLQYLLHRNTITPGVDGSFAARLTGLTAFAPAALICLMPLVAAGSASGSILLRPRAWQGRERWAAIVLLGVTGAGAASAALSVPYFAHYQNFLYAGALFGAVCASGIATRASSPAPRLPAREGWAAVPLLSIIAATTALTLAPSLTAAPRWPSGWDQLLPTSDPLAGHTDTVNDPWGRLLSQCPAGSEVVVWGWAAEWYSFASWTPASRYVVAGWVLGQTTGRDEYRRTLVDELRASPPRCIVNAVGPPWFGGFAPTDTFENSVPEFRSELRQCYRHETIPFPDRTLTLWVHRPRCSTGRG